MYITNYIRKMTFINRFEIKLLYFSLFTVQTCLSAGFCLMNRKSFIHICRASCSDRTVRFINSFLDNWFDHPIIVATISFRIIVHCFYDCFLFSLLLLYPKNDRWNWFIQ